MITEASIAAAAAQWLKDNGWDVYYEVSLEWKLRKEHVLGDARADIVGTRDQLVAVVEAKTALSFELFAQGKRWNPYADRVWVAVPRGKYTEGRVEALAIARDYYGLGILEVEDDEVRERVKPREHKRVDDALLVSLEPGHQTHAAPGTNRGGQWSSFKRTSEALARYVAEHPDCTLMEAVEAIQHHYRTKKIAIDSLAKAVKRGQIRGVKSGWRQRLQLVTAQAEEEGA